MNTNKDKTKGVKLKKYRTYLYNLLSVNVYLAGACMHVLVNIEGSVLQIS